MSQILKKRATGIQARAGPSAKRRSGFTLLELIIALALIVIVSSGVFLAFRQSDRRALHNASLMLQADLRYAQRRAMIEGRRVGVIFEPGLNRYRVVSTNPTTTLRTVYFHSGVRLRYNSFPQLHFTTRGTSSSGFTIWLYNGGYWQRLTATVAGGRIRVFDITNSRTD